MGVSKSKSFGLEMVDAGDLNGDGFSDIVAVAPDAANSYVWLYALSGNSPKDTTKVLWTVQVQKNGTPQTLVPYDFSPVISINDLDGDKVLDIAFGLSDHSTVFFYSGATGALITMVDPTVLGVSGKGYFGTSLLQVFDLDGDGVKDLIIGSPKFNHADCLIAPAKGTTGHIYAVSGASLKAGMPKTIWTLDDPPGSTNFGFSLAQNNADLDGDRVSDLLVGDNCRQNLVGGQPTQGAVHGVAGATGLLAQTFPNPATQPNWSNIMFGDSLAPTADLNGDGTPDFFAGGPNLFGSDGWTSVSLISGQNGSAICTYKSPYGGLDGFGAW